FPSRFWLTLEWEPASLWRAGLNKIHWPSHVVLPVAFLPDAFKERAKPIVEGLNIPLEELTGQLFVADLSADAARQVHVVLDDHDKVAPQVVLLHKVVEGILVRRRGDRCFPRSVILVPYVIVEQYFRNLIAGRSYTYVLRAIDVLQGFLASIVLDALQVLIKCCKTGDERKDDGQAVFISAN